MSRYRDGGDDQRQRIDRALIVGEFGDVSTLEYLRRQSRADDGRDP